jgi:hypothetical protein
MNEDHGKLRVMMSQYERDRAHATGPRVDQPAGLHAEAGGREMV